MKCGHDNCFTCPYKDCICDSEPVKKKRGRKPLPPGEKKKRKALRHAIYYEKNKDGFHDYYIKKTEGKVKRRYRSKCSELASNKAEITNDNKSITNK